MSNEVKQHGIDATTPQSFLLGAGTFYKNLVFTGGKWTGDCLGATNGGGKITITPEVYNAEVDGANVLVEGLTFMMGGSATLEANIAVLTEEVLQHTILASSKSDTTATGFKLLEPKDKIESNDYISNAGFVGHLTSGKPIVIVFEKALCTSGLDVDSVNKGKATVKLTLNAYAGIDGNLNKIPVQVYYPNAVG